MSSTTPSGISFDDRGSGSVALLFMPGWCGPRTLFEPLLERLEAHVRVLAVDWRGHGESAPTDRDFGNAELLADALDVVDTAGVDVVVPCSVAHAGWIGIALRERLGAARVPQVVLLDWMVLGAPAPFLGALAAMADPATTRSVVDQISGMWSAGLDDARLHAYIDSMTAFPDEMWARAAREINAAFAGGSPLAALAALDEPPATLHVYAQPSDPAFLAAQSEFAADHPWFRVEQLQASSHFPMFEVPDAIAGHLRHFVGAED